MSFFIVFLITLLDALALAYLVRRGVGRTAAVVNFSLIAVTYVAGLCGSLSAGVYAFFALSFALVVAALAVCGKKRDRKGLFKLVKNPVFIVYALLGVLVGVGLYNALSHDYDEMTHWALVVKNMMAYDDFGNLGDTTTMFNRYVPASGVLMYAFQIFNPSFVNGNCYAAFNVLLFSALLPLCEKYREEGNKLRFLIALCVPFALTTLLKCNAFFNLRIDALIGVLGAYIYVAFFVDRGKCDGFTVAEISLCCFVLTLAKSSGLSLCAIALAMIVLDVLLRGRGDVRRFFAKKRRFFYVLLPVVALVAAKVSWNVYCSVYEVRAGWDVSEFSLANLWAYVVHPNDFQRAVTATFWKNYFIGIPRWYAGTWQQPFTLFFPIYFALGVLLVKKQGKLYGVSWLVCSLAVLVIYAVINLFLYVFSFSYEESLRLASYPRYYGTILTLMGLIWTAVLSEFVPKDEKTDPVKRKRAVKSMQILFAAFVLVGSITLFFVFRLDADNALRDYREWQEILVSLRDTDRVYYCATQDREDYFLARFLATPTRCSGFQEGGSYKDGRSGGIYSGDPFSWDMTAEELAADVGKYDYFFVDRVDDAFRDRYSSLFADAPREKVLYRVTVDPDGNLVLVV